MKKSLAWTALVLAAGLGGCATTPSDDRQPSGMQVTRVHLGQPIARGEIRVESTDAATRNHPAFAQEQASVGRELARLGWTVLPDKATTEQVAAVRVSQTSRPNGAVMTELAVRVQRRSDATVAWEGRAQAEAQANSPMAQRAAAVDALAEALFRDFPGESGRTIRAR